MLRRQPIPDSKIIESITRRLSNCGVRSPSRVILACTNGQVTVSGVIQHEHLRHPVLRAARGVEGVRTVIDQLKKMVAGDRA